MQHVHHWLVDSENKGRCIKCNAIKDFTLANKRAFPNDYGKAHLHWATNLDIGTTLEGKLPYEGALSINQARRILYDYSFAYID